MYPPAVLVSLARHFAPVETDESGEGTAARRSIPFRGAVAAAFWVLVSILIALLLAHGVFNLLGLVFFFIVIACGVMYRLLARQGGGDPGSGNTGGSSDRARIPVPVEYPQRTPAGERRSVELVYRSA